MATTMNKFGNYSYDDSCLMSDDGEQKNRMYPNFNNIMS